MQNRPTISYIIMLGDSLSDRGAMAHRYLLGFIPMRWVSGLAGVSPEGRFTNGLAWSDHIAAALANIFTIKRLTANNRLDFTDISDAILAKDKRMAMLKDAYDLDHDLSVEYKGKEFIRSYNEGGLTAYNYKWHPTKSFKRFFSRLILPTLQSKREELADYDIQHKITIERKLKTLIIEWSGANDLITVNEKPTKAEVDKAIRERMNNAKKLIELGYTNFILINLPDLSLTPRYQLRSEKERLDAHKWSMYFNEQFALACEKLSAENPHCFIELFDINKEFSYMHAHPEKYDLDKDKLIKPFIDSPDFKLLPNNTSPSDGYMFWDGVHPTADVHAIFAAKCCANYRIKFYFEEPQEVKTNRDESRVKRGVGELFVNDALIKYKNDRFFKGKEVVDEKWESEEETYSIKNA